MVARTAKAKKPALKKFTIDCSAAVEEGIIDAKELETYLTSRIKVDGKTGNLGSKVAVERTEGRIGVTAAEPFSKRYLKYLTKKYLKKVQIRDFLRVIADGPSTYKLKLFQFQDEEEEEDAE